MAQVHHFSTRINISPALPEDTTVKMFISPNELMKTGFNIPVSISTPSSIKSANPDAEINSVVVMAHFDTGASKTSIDQRLAEYLHLTAVGVSTIHTAAGAIPTPNYAVDISFPGSQLAPFINLPINSCNLALNFENGGKIPLSAQNFGLLIGRDIMSRWNIVWNGPTSTVFISD